MYCSDMVQSPPEEEELVPWDLLVPLMTESRDLGGDRHCPLQIHVWVISWVGSEHPLWSHCEPQAVLAHRLGDTVERATWVA